MKDFIDGNFLANMIRMRRSSYSGTFIIVEGRSDKLIYERLVESQKCDFNIANGRKNAIEALEILEKDNFQGVLAIVDADFTKLDNLLLTTPNLLLTDDHDLEIMLIKSPALDKIIQERGSEDKIKKFNESNSSQDIRIKLIEIGKELGYLRWLSLREDLSLKFEELDFAKFIDKNTLKIDISKLITTVKNHSQKPSLVEQDIQNRLEKLQGNDHDSWQICCGHDLICILSLGLMKLWGTLKYNEVKSDDLERELRLAYQDTYFTETELYLSIKQWEKENKNYQVLRDNL